MTLNFLKALRGQRKNAQGFTVAGEDHRGATDKFLDGLSGLSKSVQNAPRAAQKRLSIIRKKKEDSPSYFADEETTKARPADWMTSHNPEEDAQSWSRSASSETIGEGSEKDDSVSSRDEPWVESAEEESSEEVDPEIDPETGQARKLSVLSAAPKPGLASVPEAPKKESTDPVAKADKSSSKNVKHEHKEVEIKSPKKAKEESTGLESKPSSSTIGSKTAKPKHERREAETKPIGSKKAKDDASEVHQDASAISKNATKEDAKKSPHKVAKAELGQNEGSKAQKKVQQTQQKKIESARGYPTSQPETSAAPAKLGKPLEKDPFADSDTEDDADGPLLSKPAANEAVKPAPATLGKSAATPDTNLAAKPNALPKDPFADSESDDGAYVPILSRPKVPASETSSGTGPEGHSTKLLRKKKSVAKVGDGTAPTHRIKKRVVKARKNSTAEVAQDSDGDDIKF